MISPLALKNLEPLARGRERLVFEHPDTPQLLVKVMRPDLADARYGKGAVWYRRRRRFGPYVVFMREIREYVAAYANAGHSLPFAQQVVGLAETDLGLGLIIGAVRGPDGRLAPTAATLIANGEFDQRAEEALEEFLADLLESDLVIADLHEQNIVYAYNPNGERHFVMIDGLGSANLLPFKSWSRHFNRRSKIKRIARLRARIAPRLAAFHAGNPIR